MTRTRTSGRSFLLAKPALLLAAIAGLMSTEQPASAAPRPYVPIITVDDMSADSLGSFGCELPDTSPNIDSLARQGMRFNRAHVVVGKAAIPDGE